MQNYTYNTNVTEHDIREIEKTDFKLYSYDYNAKKEECDFLLLKAKKLISASVGTKWSVLHSGNSYRDCVDCDELIKTNEDEDFIYLKRTLKCTDTHPKFERYTDVLKYKMKKWN